MVSIESVSHGKAILVFDCVRIKGCGVVQLPSFVLCVSDCLCSCLLFIQQQLLWTAAKKQQDIFRERTELGRCV